MLVELCLLIFFLFSLFYWFITKDYDFFDGKGIKTSRPSFPYGSQVTKQIMSGKLLLTDFPRYLVNEFPKEKVIGYFAFHTPRILINDEELAKHIMIKDFEYFVDRQSTTSGNKIHQNFLLNLKGADWKKMRGLMSGVFTSGKLKQMFPNLLAAGKNLEDYIEKVCEEGKEVDMKTVGGYLTLDSIASAGFGIDTDTFSDPEHLFRRMALRLTDAPGYAKQNRVIKLCKVMFCRLFPFLASKVLKLDVFDAEALNFFKDIVTKTYRQRSNSSQKRRDDLIDLIIDEVKKSKDSGVKSQEADQDEFDKNATITNNDNSGTDIDVETLLISNSLLFFFAGFETSATGISIASQRLCLYPEVQEKVRQEILDVVGVDGDITFDKLKDLKYMDMFLNESLRSVDIFTFIERTCTKNYKIPGTDFVVPKGTAVAIFTRDTQENEKNFINAKKFDPENFNPENKPNKFAFQVFGQGPRNCIGMRYAMLIMKICMVSLLRRYEVRRGSTMKDELKLTKQLNSFDGGVPVTFHKI